MKKILLSCFLVALVFSAWAQERTIRGKVTSVENGSPLPGVNVVVKGTTTGTVTDVSGNYTLSAPESDITLVFSFIGLETEEIQVGDRTTVDIQMAPDITQLTEIVVVAYGEQTKQSITGSVATLETKDIVNNQASHLAQGLVGRIAGVQVINQNGQPGESPTIQFRGIGSINASSSPLYVVDGVPFNGNINAINPQDIESVSFLKEASANALYGSRGANGVIIITTKKGKTAGLEVTFDAKLGRSTRAVPDYDIVTDPGQFYEVWFDRLRMTGLEDGLNDTDARNFAAAELVDGTAYGLGYNNYNVPGDQLVTPETGRLNPSATLLYHDDWANELFKPATRQEYYVSLRSKTDNVGTYFSLGYLDDAGYVIQSGFSRVTSRLALDYDYNKNLKFGGSVNYARTDQDAPLANVGSSTYSNLFSWARNVAPIYPIWARNASGGFMLDAQGQRIWDFGEANDGIPGVRPYGAFNNPVATTLEDVDRNQYEQLSGRGYIEYSFLKNFKFRYNISTDVVNGDFTEFATPIGGDAKNAGGRLRTTSSKAVTMTHQQLLNWDGKIGEDHDLGVMLGHESNEWTYDYLSAHRTNAVIPNLAQLSNTSNFQDLQGYQRFYNVEGFFSRLNYSFRDKLFVNANYRRDGSSVFHPDNRWGNFYGVGAAWTLSKESFMSGVSFVDQLRVKASYGSLGNDGILYDETVYNPLRRNYYPYTSQYTVVNAGGGAPGFQFISVGNPDLTWETTENINAGFEAGLMNGRLNLNVEYFTRNISDMIYNRPVPLNLGFPSVAENIGDMENKGIEITIDGQIVKQSDFSFGMSINATHYKNEITRMPLDAEGESITIDDVNFQLEVGHSRYDYFMREFAGVDAANGDALWYYTDENDDDGDGNVEERLTTSVWNNADEYYVGKSAIPDLMGGFAMNFGYKAITLDVNFAYQIGGYGFDGVYQGLMAASNDIGQNYHKDVLKTWTPENTTASLPRLGQTKFDQSNQSNLYLVDASYLSLQNVTLGYNLPGDLLSNIGFKSVMVYFTANNVKLWSKRQGFDPRLSVTAATTNEYSIVRSTSIGVTAKF